MNSTEDDIDSSSSNSSDNALVHLVLLFLFLWSSFYGISAMALNHLIQFFNYLFLTISKCSPNVSSLATLFPTLLYKAQSFYDIKKNHLKNMLYVKNVDCFTASKIALKLLVVLPIQNFAYMCLFKIIHIIHVEDLVAAN